MWNVKEGADVIKIVVEIIGNAKDRIFWIFVYRKSRNSPIFFIEFEPVINQCFRTRENFAKQMWKYMQNAKYGTTVQK